MATKQKLETPEIIVVMDDRQRSMTVATILRRNGAKVMVFETLKDALETAKRKPVAAFFVEYSSRTAVAISVAVDHGIPIYAINFSATRDAQMTLEVIESGVDEVFGRDEIESKALSLVTVLSKIGNRYAEDANVCPLSPPNIDRYSVREISELPTSYRLGQHSGSAVIGTDSVQDGIEGAVDTDLPTRFIDTDGDSTSPTTDSAMGKDGAGDPALSEFDILERRLNYRFWEQERLLLRKVARRLRVSTEGQEIRIHQIASAVTALESEEWKACVAELHEMIRDHAKPDRRKITWTAYIPTRRDLLVAVVTAAGILAGVFLMFQTII